MMTSVKESELLKKHEKTLFYECGKDEKGKACGKGKLYAEKPVDIFGDGTLTDPVVIYEGDFKDGMFDGTGKLVISMKFIFPEVIYEGEFKCGKFDGKGKYVIKKDEIYEGLWKEGRIVKGTHSKYKGNQKYTGEFNEKNLFNGKGSLLDIGKTYDGTFKDGKKEGKYVVKNNDGEVVIEGDYKDDALHGTVKTYKFYQKIRHIAYDGEFENGERCGKGKYYMYNPDTKNAEIYLEGEFKGDVLVKGKKYGFDYVFEGNFTAGPFKDKMSYLNGWGTRTFLDKDGKPTSLETGNWFTSIEKGSDLKSYKRGFFKSEYIRESGNMIIYCYFKGDDVKDGKFRLVYPDGKKFEGTYKNDKVDGIGYWYEGGKIYERVYEMAKKASKGYKSEKEVKKEDLKDVHAFDLSVFEKKI